MNKSELKPALVFEQFAKINEIPRPSKHEENMIEFLKSFGEAHQLETLVDETGNVLIRKAATPGYGGRRHPPPAGPRCEEARSRTRRDRPRRACRGR